MGLQRAINMRSRGCGSNACSILRIVLLIAVNSLELAGGCRGAQSPADIHRTPPLALKAHRLAVAAGAAEAAAKICADGVRINCMCSGGFVMAG